MELHGIWRRVVHLFGSRIWTEVVPAAKGTLLFRDRRFFFFFYLENPVPLSLLSFDEVDLVQTTFRRKTLSRKPRQMQRVTFTFTLCIHKIAVSHFRRQTRRMRHEQSYFRLQHHLRRCLLAEDQPVSLVSRGFCRNARTASLLAARAAAEAASAQVARPAQEVPFASARTSSWTARAAPSCRS